MSRDLVLRLGTYARNGSYFPLPYKDWRHVPGVRKDDVWKLIEDIYEFDDPPTAQRWIFMSLGHKWRDFKVRLKKRRYDVHDSDAARIKDRDPRVDESQWRKLIAYWGTKAAKMLSKRNKVSRSKMDMLHSCGTKSTARYRDEETKKRSDGTVPSRDEIFIITHTRKNKEYTDSASKEKAEKLLDLASSKADSLESCSASKDDVYSQVIGPDKRGFVRGMGLGVTPSQLWGTSVHARAKRREAELVRENKKLRTKVNMLEERQETMQAELTEVKMMIQQLTNGIRPGDDHIATSHVDSSEGDEHEEEDSSGDEYEEVEEDSSEGEYEEEDDSSGDGDSSEDE